MVMAILTEPVYEQVVKEPGGVTLTMSVEEAEMLYALMARGYKEGVFSNFYYTLRNTLKTNSWDKYQIVDSHGGYVNIPAFNVKEIK